MPVTDEIRTKIHGFFEAGLTRQQIVQTLHGHGYEISQASVYNIYNRIEQSGGEKWERLEG